MKDITIDDLKCWRCGEKFTQEGVKKTKHHSIPQFLKPKLNVTIPLCDKCHKEINSHYAHQQKKNKAPKPYYIFANRLEGLGGSFDRLKTKLLRIHEEMIKEIKNLEQH